MTEIEKLSEEIKTFLLKKDKNEKAFFNHIFSRYCTKHALPEKYGGTGGSFTDIYSFTRSLTEKTANIGISLSILINLLILKIISIYGTHRQKDKYLKNAVEKGYVFSFAVSEPGAGPHPKYLKTHAEKKADSYIINGEKTFTTNAPVSDFSIIIAITSVDEKKRYSAFFADSNDSDITIEPMENLPFFRDCPHGTIRLNNFKSDESELLGEKDKAYDELVMSFRKYEDILMAGPVLGALNYLVSSVLKKNKNIEDKNFFYESGALIASVKALDFLCEKTCAELESRSTATEFIHLFFREEIKGLIERFRNLCSMFELTLENNEKEILEDLSNSGRIAFKSAWNKLVKLAKNESL